MNNLYKEVFVEFFFDPDSKRLYQKALHEDFCHFFVRGECVWHTGSEDLLKDAFKVGQLFLERAEDNWTEELMGIPLGPAN